MRLSLELGELQTAVEYLQAQQIQAEIKHDFNNSFKTVDTIVAPTLPFAAPKLGQESIRTNNEELSIANELIRLSVPANLAGVPSISIPCGFSENMPVGIQFIGKTFDEQTILKVAYAFESTNPTQNKKPLLDTPIKNM